MALQPDESGPNLSPAEWEVMKVLWEHGSMAARDVHAALPPENEWAIKTVKTLLSRLVAKGAVDYVVVGNSYLYSAAITREDSTIQEVGEFVERVMDGNVPHAIARFVKAAGLKPEELAELRRLLADQGEGTSRGRRKGS